MAIGIDLIIENGTVVFNGNILKTDIAIENGKIIKIGNRNHFPAAERVINAEGKLVFPGAIDTHTHFEQPFMGEVPPETWDQGTIAAAFGGNTMHIDFVVQEHGKSLLDAIKAKVSYVDALSAIDFSFHACFTDFSDMDMIRAEVRKIIEYGIPSFKEYMTYRKEGYFVNDGELYQLLREVQKFGGIVGVHAENTFIAESLIEEFLKEGKKSAKYHPLAKPNFVEAEAIQRAISIANFAGARLYVVHLSTKEGLHLIKEAKCRGEPIFAETCPHYLTLTDDVYSRPDGINYIMSPPLRKKDDIEALWKGLSDGTISVTGTDHIAYTSEQKRRHSETFANVPNGVPGVELRLPIIYSEGVRKGRISLTRMVDICSTNAAKLFGLYPKKGAILPGSDADIVIFDPKIEKTITVETLHMGTDYTIYEGMKVTGWPVITILRGKVIVENESYLGKKGDGSFIKGRIVDEIIDTV